MNHINQRRSSTDALIHHAMKRKRGRPRKDKTLQSNATTAQVPPGFGGAKECTSQTSDRKDGVDPMVGQHVTGIVEATFDAGYLLNINVGNSNMNLRGLVFKPGRYVPVTPENDIAPHMQMLGRNEFDTPVTNQGWFQNQNLAIQSVGTKRKYKSRRRVDSSSHSTSGRGNVLPVSLQPVNQMLDFGGKDVHEVEPLSMLPADRSVPVSQVFVGTPASNEHQICEGSGKLESGACNKGASEVGQGEKDNPMKFTNSSNSQALQTSDGQTGSGKEELKPLTEDPRTVSEIGDGDNTMPLSTESLQTATTTPANKPLFGYGNGKMTELLQAVQENAKDSQVQCSQKPASAFNIDFTKQG